MIIQSKVDIAILFIGIITIGILGGLISSLISDWRYSTLNTPTNPELTKGQKKPVKENEIQPSSETIEGAKPPKVPNGSVGSSPTAHDLLYAVSNNASNIRHVDGERQWVGGDEFIEGLKYHISKELVSE